MAKERLQKLIARAGVASRREAEEMIKAGRVTVNGQIVTELGSKADADTDHVKVDGRLLRGGEKKRYILLYKPKGVMTTMNDPEGRTTVRDLLRGVKERVYPVGRLDFHSEGLILLTNDGDLAFKVTHPSQGSVKTYHVKVRGVPGDPVIEKLQRGVSIDGRRTMACEIERLKTTGRGDAGNAWLEVRLREGRTQQIRKMFAYAGHPVAKLRRVAIGDLRDPGLRPGQWRDLSPREVSRLGAERPKARPHGGDARKPAPSKRTVARLKTSHGVSAVPRRTKKSTSKRRSPKGTSR